MLGYLIFKSDSEHLMSEEELIVLLNKARSNNKKNNISGMLIYVESMDEGKLTGHFTQILEGNVRVIRTTFQRIKKDKRHREVQMINKGVILNRSFPDWTMGFKHLKNGDYTELKSHFEFNEKIEGLNMKNKALSSIEIMKTFYNQMIK